MPRKGERISERVARSCAHCLSTFEVYASTVERGEGRFCSASCRARGRHRSLEERFWERVDKSGPVLPGLTACWAWRGAPTSTGYGIVGAGRRSGRRLYAHRVSWEIHRGPIPPGAHLCHRCDNRLCVNPDHLFLGDSSSNLRDACLKGRHSNGRRSRSGVRGVYLGRDGAYSVQIRVRGRVITIGTFHSFDDAVAARRGAEREFWADALKELVRP